MKHLKSKSKIIGLILGLFIFSIVVVSLTVYAKPVNAMFVDYSNMEQIDKDVYVEPDLKSDERTELLEYVMSSQDKVADVFGERVSSPYLIVTLSQQALKKYAENTTGQTYYYPWKNYIVVGPKGLNVSVISHEFTHAELRERLHNKNKVPVWFDEGLATMVDGRYSNYKKVWLQYSNNGEIPVDYSLLDSHQAFHYGNAEAWTNYNLACYEVSRWYTIVGSSGLIKLIDELNKGEQFDVKYKLLEAEASNRD